ncbi:MAG: hypothetical protein ABSA64_05920 [Sedimentisphaerales bacterium]|jgi:hypothetical protein
MGSNSNKPDVKTETNEYLKSLPMPELEKKWRRRRKVSVKLRRGNG